MPTQYEIKEMAAHLQEVAEAGATPPIRHPDELGWKALAERVFDLLEKQKSGTYDAHLPKI